MITESRVCYDGVHTRVLSVAGDGSPIVLLPGYGDSADTWRGVLPLLEAAGRQAFAVDLPGFGQADPRRPGPLVPQFDAVVDALVARYRPVVLVGNSLGAATALHAANRHPDGVSGVVAIDDPVSATRRVAAAVLLSRLRPLFAALGAVPIPQCAVTWSASWVFRRLLYGSPRDAAPEVIAYWVARLSTPAAIAALLSGACRYAREIAYSHDELDITCPVLIVHGGKDIIIPVAASRNLHAKIAGSELVVLPRSGHCPQLDDPRGVARLIVDFLSRTQEKGVVTA